MNVNVLVDETTFIMLDHEKIDVYKVADDEKSFTYLKVLIARIVAMLTKLCQIR